MISFKEKLREEQACREALEWVGDKSPKETWEQCERGDWMLWWYCRADNYDKRKAMLVKGHCANTVRHLMKDIRSTAAVDAAIAYGNGELDDQQLRAAATAALDVATGAIAAVDGDDTTAYAVADATAYAVADAAYIAAADGGGGSAADATADAAASYAAADAAFTTEHTTTAAIAAIAASVAANNARRKNLQETADICRTYLPMPVFNDVI